MAAFSLLNLPVEIVTAICEALCPHCYVQSLGFMPMYRARLVQTLLSLSRTCRTLRTIAQPFLYHRVHPYSFPRLLRTLIARPDLAAAVRIVNDDVDEVTGLEDGQTFEIIAAGAAKAGITLPMLWRALWPENNNNPALRLVLLAHTPNVEALMWKTHSLFDNQAIREAARGIKLDHLRFLDLYCEEVLPPPGIHLGHATGLIAMAPNLEGLGVDLCLSVPPDLSLPKVKQLRLTRSCIGVDHFAWAVAAAPLLEELWYYSGGVEVGPLAEDIEVTPAGMWPALRTRRHGLKALRFDIENSYEMYGMDLASQCLMGSLADFTALESLFIGANYIRTTDADLLDEEDGGGQSDEVEPGALARKLLPRSLRRVAFRRRADAGLALTKSFVAAVGNGDFPNLEEFWAAAEDDALESLRESVGDKAKVIKYEARFAPAYWWPTY